MSASCQWTPEEDEKLRDLVDQFGPKRWSDISKQLGTKGPKQCRRRWKNYLDAELKTGAWTDEEDRKLLDAHDTMGNKWTEIAKLIGGRTDNAVKNRFAALQKRTKAANARRSKRPRTQPPADTGPSLGMSGGFSTGMGFGGLASPGRMAVGSGITSQGQLQVPGLTLPSPIHTPTGATPTGLTPSFIGGIHGLTSMPLPSIGSGLHSPGPHMEAPKPLNLTVAIPSDPTNPSATGDGMGMATSMGIVTAHIAREALTPAELNMIGEINQMTPFDIRIEDQPLTLARATELQRQYSARGNGRLASVEDVMQWFGTPRHLQQGGNIFSERGQGGGQGAGEGVGEQRQAPTQAEPPGTSGCDVVPMKSQHRNVLARVVQMSQQNREFLKQATHNAARSAAAGAAMKALQSAKEKAGKASPAARGQQGAPEGSGGEVEGVGEGGGKAGAEDTGGAAGVVVGGPGAEIGGDKGAGEAFASMELSLGNLGSLGNFDDDSLHLSGVLPSLDDEEMRLLQKVLQDPAVPISTPKSIPQTNIFKSPRKTS